MLRITARLDADRRAADTKFDAERRAADAKFDAERRASDAERRAFEAKADADRRAHQASMDAFPRRDARDRRTTGPGRRSARRPGRHRRLRTRTAGTPQASTSAVSWTSTTLSIIGSVIGTGLALALLMLRIAARLDADRRAADARFDADRRAADVQVRRGPTRRRGQGRCRPARIRGQGRCRPACVPGLHGRIPRRDARDRRTTGPGRRTARRSGRPRRLSACLPWSQRPLRLPRPRRDQCGTHGTETLAIRLPARLRPFLLLYFATCRPDDWPAGNVVALQIGFERARGPRDVAPPVACPARGGGRRAQADDVSLGTAAARPAPP